MASFLPAVLKLIEIEGGYVNRPDDRGGPTKYGISQKSYTHLDIEHLTIEEATAIYFRDFWNPLYDGIPSQLLADELLDVGVNRGTVAAVKMLQECLLALGSRLAVDGVFGKQTLEELCRYHPDRVLNRFYHRQCIGYVRIVKRDTSQLSNLEGWINRVFL
jgi:lysozyme family protein